MRTSKAQKRAEAIERQKRRDARSPQEQLDRLKARGFRAEKESKKLIKQILKEKQK